MPEQFQWVPDIDRGEWLRPMEAEPFGSTLSIVPRGFEAYARIFHPVHRDRPRDTKTWQGIDEFKYFDGIRDINASLETQQVTWAQAAASFNTMMHSEAQYAAILGCEVENTAGAIAPDGWRYHDTWEGSLDVASLAAAAEVLSAHTATPDAGVAAIWVGWGGLVSAAGAAYVMIESDDLSAARASTAAGPSIVHALRTRLAAGMRQAIAGVRSMLRGLPHKQPKPGTGVLSHEAAAGPRFDLHADTGRRYILFEAGPDAFADPTWPSRAPWASGVIGAQSPSILWPDDHAWVLATEIDYDSTLGAGTSELIQELTQTPGLEALQIRSDADLSIVGDTLNRPK